MRERDRRRSSRGANWRTGDTGCIRFNRDFSRIGVGRITISSRTRNEKEFHRRNDILTKLADSAQIETLRALQAGKISIEQLEEAEREQRLKSADLLGTLTLNRPLWLAIAETLPSMGAGDRTRKRYEVSLGALRRKGVATLGEKATVADLARVNWRDVRAGWGRSPSDWNHLRRAISAFLTALLGDKFHPFRRTVVSRIPIAAESARVPDVTPVRFWEIIRHIPERYRACFIAIAATGMRVGEYLACTPFSLRPNTRTVFVPGTKTVVSAETVPVHPKLWPYVKEAIPSPLAYKALRRHWKAACKAAKVDVRIHDLRHCFGQWASDAGVPEARIQSALRHKTASMTRRYTAARERGEAANAVGEVLLKAQRGKRAAQVAAQGGNRGRA